MSLNLDSIGLFRIFSYTHTVALGYGFITRIGFTQISQQHTFTYVLITFSVDFSSFDFFIIYKR